MSYLGLDIGTTSCKGTAINSNGQILAKEYEEYHIGENTKGFELNSELVWEKTQEIIKKISEKIFDDPIQSISISGAGDTITPVNKKFQSLHSSLLAFDNRSAAESEYFSKKFGRKELFQLTGMPAHPMYSVSKILWLKKNQPDIFKNTGFYLCYEDLIFSLLGGEPFISYSNAARTMMFDINQKQWIPEILNYCGIKASQLAIPESSGKVFGKVLPEVAERLNISKDTKLVTGAHDQVCSALGAGVVKENILLDSSGTFEILFSVVDKTQSANNLLNSSMCIYPHAIENKFATFGMIPTAGAAFKWFRDQFCQDEIRQAKTSNTDPYDLIISHFFDQPSSLYFYPYLSGSGTPWMDAKATGCLSGILLSTNRYEIGQSILEGISYEIKTNIDYMEKAGIKIEEIYCVGGGAKSRYWTQLKSNVIGKPISSSSISDTAPLGAAILAGFGVGGFSTIEAAIEMMHFDQTKFYPNDEISSRYQEAYQKYILSKKSHSVLP